MTIVAAIKVRGSSEILRWVKDLEEFYKIHRDFEFLTINNQSQNSDDSKRLSKQFSIE